jgi:hypothetical protein
MEKTQKSTFGEMRSSGVTGILVYCADYKWSPMVPIDASQWPDEGQAFRH